MKKIGLFLGIVFAILLHAGFLLFGGVLFVGAEASQGRMQEVELLDDDDVEKEEEKLEEKPPEELETEAEDAPDAEEMLRNLDQTPVNTAPELEAMSLNQLEAALSGQAGSGDFAEALNFGSGGVIGGKGKAGGLDDSLEKAFSIDEIDQKPRATFQAAASYPSEMRGKKYEGVVSVLFVVDSSGKVTNPRVDKSNHAAFEKPALDAVKKWKFEPAVKGGERVACKMRVSVRFPPS
jgi:protein TonB